MNPTYHWGRYAAIHEGTTRFAQRYHQLQEAIADTVERLEDRVKTALEFGTGEGGTTQRVLERLPRLRIRCVDVDKKALETARKTLAKYEHVAFSNEDVLDVSGQYGLVFAAFVIHNFGDNSKEQLIRHAYNLLRPHGTLVIGDVMTYADEGLTRKEWKRDYAMIAKLPKKDHAFWKRHFDEYDRPLAATVHWYQRAMRNAGLAAEVAYRDGFWTVLTGTRA